MVDALIRGIVNNDDILSDILNMAMVNDMFLVLMRWLWSVILVITILPIIIRVVRRWLITLNNTVVICPAWWTHIVILR